ncbi:MAG: nitroreductase family deazaflavin-dependent oxidoreductase, partial [Sphingomonadales bacterium]|nr:nitroreductase family deazaflavin-dependent oxidoreductase [Sphingomonadales bacterium]
AATKRYHAAGYRACQWVIVTHTGNKTGAIRKTPLMRVRDGESYVLVGSQGGAPKDPVWVHNLRANPHVEQRRQR